MKLHRLLVPVFAAIILTLPAMAGDDDTPMAKEMGKVKKALKAVQKSPLDAASKEANLAKIDEAKKAMEEAGKNEPAMTKDVPEAEKAKFLADFKASMDQTIKAFDELKAAISADKADEAKKIIEKLNEQMKEGHKKFKKD